MEPLDPRMNTRPPNLRRNLLRAIAAGAAAALAPRPSTASRPPARTAELALDSPRFAAAFASLDASRAARLSAVDPARVSAADVRDVLAFAPAPRIVLLQGSIPIVTMAPFAAFLAGMGYPQSQLESPRDRNTSMSSHGDSASLAGMLAWHYERDGVRPLVIGHSQGGMLAVRVLHELAGAFNDTLPVWNPRTERAESRFAVCDPLSGLDQPVVGFRIPFASAIATGTLFRVLLGQWTMLAKLRRIPDSVDEFTGFAVAGDLIGAGGGPYTAIGEARVRNVNLPPSYGHVGLPLAAHLADDARARAWIEAYVPGETALPIEPTFDGLNLLHAADIWYSVKKHWCREAQRAAIPRPA